MHIVSLEKVYSSHSEEKRKLHR